ncbi:MAG TPA: ABC-type transport auxiliary lipoprotein family protein, partial [Rhizomicrobium sp.]|nr:ABC-type transport auxiliary lipoprotein family protein [Rhizomicrobium sp.]
PPAAIYILSPDLPDTGNPVRSPFQLAVALPHCSASLASARIALSRNAMFDYYADAQWTDTTPRLLQDLLVRALERGGALGAVARDSEGVHSDYVLESTIEAFEAHYEHGDSGAPTIAAGLTVRLVSVARGEIIGAHTFYAQAAAAANSIPAAVQAFNTALSQLLPQIARWSLATLPPK